MWRVVSWNVNSVKARKDRLIDYLKRTSPDVVCLQELKCVEESFPWEAIKEAGYDAAVFGQKTYNGVAILSRDPLADIERGFGDGHPDEAARFVGATIRGVRVYSAYIPNGQAVGTDKYGYKLEWMRRLRAYLDKRHRPDESLLVAGDFNVAPEDRDVHDPDAWDGAILCSLPERNHLAEVCRFGLFDTLRKHHPESGIYSWWDYRELSFPKNKGLRIDFIFTTKPLLDRCRAASVAREERKGSQPSDHAPVVAEFDLD